MIQYLVAKYIGNPIRMEPRNIGIVARFGERVFVRFIGQKPNQGRLDLRSVRHLVSHTATYKQWIDYWLHVIDSANDVEKAFAELVASSNTNFVVVSGEPIFPPEHLVGEPHLLTDYLFQTVVAGNEAPDGDEKLAAESRLARVNLNRQCARIIRQYGLGGNPRFEDTPIVPCSLIGGTTGTVQPSYAYRNGSEIYFQKVAVEPHTAEATQKEINNAAFIFERLKADDAKRQTTALIKVGHNGEPMDSAATSFLNVLSAFADQIIDVDDPEQVERTFSKLEWFG